MIALALPATAAAVPVTSLASFLEQTNPQYQHPAGSIMWFNPTASGSFSVQIAASSGAGITRVDFPPLGSVWTPTGGSSDTTAPSPYVGSYAWSMGATSPGFVVATAWDAIPSSATTGFSVLADSIAPSGGSIAAPSGWMNSTSTSITHAGGSDSQSRMASNQLQRRSASIVSGACGGFSPWSNIGPANPVSPFVDATIAEAICYQYRLVMSDNVSNFTIVTSPGTAMVDRTMPGGSIDATPTSPFAGTVLLQGTSFDNVSVQSVDVGFSGPTSGTICLGASASGGSWSCSWSTSMLPDGMYSVQVTVRDSAGNLSSPINRVVVVNNTGPSASFGGWIEGTNPQYMYSGGSSMYINTTQSGSFTLLVNASDLGSGLDRVEFPNLGLGFSPGGNDNTAPSPYSFTYSWTASAFATGNFNAYAFDLAGQSTAMPFTVIRDATAPYGATLSASETSATVNSVTFAGGTDAHSGVATRQIQRRAAVRSSGTCGAFTGWADHGAVNPASPYVDSGVGNTTTCYEYRLLVIDNVGNGMTTAAARAIASTATVIVVGGGALAVAESGSTDSFSLVLGSMPSADVTVYLDFGVQLVAWPSIVTFTQGNWNVPQTITVTALDDLIAEGSHQGTLELSVSSADPAFAGFVLAPLLVDITDDDQPGVAIAPIDVSITEGGATSSYNIALESQPTAYVTVFVDPDAQVEASPNSLTFTPANWNVAQQVIVTAVDDAAVEANPHTGIIRNVMFSADPYYDGLALPNVTAHIVDNDVAAPPLDVTGPIGGSVLYPSGATSATSSAVVFVSGTDPESGIARWRLQRRVAPLSGGECARWGGWTTAGASSPVSPYVEVLPNHTCVQFRLVVTDRASNESTFSNASIIRVDRIAPYGSIDHLAGNLTGVISVSGSAIDVASRVRVDLRATGPSLVDVCVGATVTSGTWSCAWNTALVTAGLYELAATITDDAGNQSTERLTVRVAAPPRGDTTTAPPVLGGDTAPPAFTKVTVPRIAWGPVALVWATTDNSGVAVRYRIEQRAISAIASRWSPWRASGAAQVSTSLALRLRVRGSTTCFRVIATDASGNAATSSEVCSTVPLDDRDLDLVSGWRLQQGPVGSLLRTLATATRARASATERVAGADVALIVATGPTSGSMRIYHGSKLLRTVSLTSSTVRQRVLVQLPKLTKPSSALLRFEAVGNGQVELDGLLVDRTP